MCSGVSWARRCVSETNIPPLANVKIGDTVKTDGRSSYFPRGISIGYVKSTRLQSDQNFFEVTVNLSTDFAKLHNVYVVKDVLINELDFLITVSYTHRTLTTKEKDEL